MTVLGGPTSGATLPAMAERGARLDEESDGELARRVAALPPGQTTECEEVLFQRFSRRVYLYGLRHLRDEDAADDLAQDVMTVVLRRLRAGEVREPDRIASFVLGTARMLTHEEWRRRRKKEDLAMRISAESERTVPAREPLDLERLSECLDALPERERAVVVLSFGAEQTAQEIGEATGLSAGNVRVIRHRAVARLSRCMGLATEVGP